MNILAIYWTILLVTNPSLKIFIMTEKEEIWRTLREVAENLKRTNETLDRVIEAQKEDKERIDKLLEVQKEQKERLDELLEAQKEQKERLDRLIESQEKDKERINELFELHKQTQMELRELKERQEQTEREIIELREAQKESYKNLTKSISDLNGTWQNYTENIILEGFEYAARKYGLRLIQPAFKPPIRRIKGEDFEIDGIAVGLDFVIVIETKTKPTRKAIKQLESNLKRFLKFYPEYRNYRIYGAIAGIVSSDEIKDLAESKGFFVIKHKDGKDVKILNEKNFKPKDYSKTSLSNNS